MLKLGGNVDSWCTKCTLILAHTVEAMVSDKPTRVRCNTCKAQHSYRPLEPVSAARQSRERKVGAAPEPRAGKPRASRYQGLLKGKDMTLAKRYSPQDNYAPGDVLDHPNFGVGVATALRNGTKIEVLFEDGSKVLVHGR